MFQHTLSFLVLKESSVDLFSSFQYKEGDLVRSVRYRLDFSHQTQWSFCCQSCTFPSHQHPQQGRQRPEFLSPQGLHLHPEAWLCLWSASFGDFYTRLLRWALEVAPLAHPDRVCLFYPSLVNLSWRVSTGETFLLGWRVPALEWGGDGDWRKTSLFDSLLQQWAVGREPPGGWQAPCGC